MGGKSENAVSTNVFKPRYRVRKSKATGIFPKK